MFSHTCCMVSCIFPNSAVTIDWNISERGGRKQRRRFQIRHIKMGLCHVWRHSLKRVSSLTRHPTKLSKSMVYLESAYLPITDCRTLVFSWKPGEEKKKKKRKEVTAVSWLLGLCIGGRIMGESHYAASPKNLYCFPDIKHFICVR